jgi:RNA polymerase sigma-70 factor (ECF subfamily)
VNASLKAIAEKPEPELVADCKRGDRAALTELFGRYYASCLSLARGMLRSVEESQDAVQWAYVSALRHLYNFRGDATFKTWITRIVMNHCLARLRERRRRRDLISLEDLNGRGALTVLASAAPTPEKSTLSHEIACALSDAAARLPKSLHEVFALCALSGLSLKEAAAVLGITVGATKTRLCRAHQCLRSHLEPVWSDGRKHTKAPRKKAKSIDSRAHHSRFHPAAAFVSSWAKASNSAFTRSLSVWHMPCGAPL